MGEQAFWAHQERIALLRDAWAMRLGLEAATASTTGAGAPMQSEAARPDPDASDGGAAAPSQHGSTPGSPHDGHRRDRDGLWSGLRGGRTDLRGPRVGHIRLGAHHPGAHLRRDDRAKCSSSSVSSSSSSDSRCGPWNDRSGGRRRGHHGARRSLLARDRCSGAPRRALGWPRRSPHDRALRYEPDEHPPRRNVARMGRAATRSGEQCRSRRHGGRLPAARAGAHRRARSVARREARWGESGAHRARLRHVLRPRLPRISRGHRSHRGRPRAHRTANHDLDRVRLFHQRHRDGAQFLLNGHADVVVAGGADTLLREAFAGFSALGVLSPAKCAPFSEPEGTTLGEGAGMVVVEREADAARRGARPWASVHGYGLSADGFHETTPDPTGSGLARAIRCALQDAGWTRESVDFVSAHATGTTNNESDRVVGRRARARSAGRAAALERLEEPDRAHARGRGSARAHPGAPAPSGRSDPATLHFRGPRAGCPGNPVAASRPRTHPVARALKFSAAFGGANAVLAYGAPRIESGPAARACVARRRSRRRRGRSHRVIPRAGRRRPDRLRAVGPCREVDLGGIGFESKANRSFGAMAHCGHGSRPSATTVDPSWGGHGAHRAVRRLDADARRELKAVPGGDPPQRSGGDLCVRVRPHVGERPGRRLLARPRTARADDDGVRRRGQRTARRGAGGGVARAAKRRRLHRRGRRGRAPTVVGGRG